jgi:hypothetical protein
MKLSNERLNKREKYRRELLKRALGEGGEFTFEGSLKSIGKGGDILYCSCQEGR